MEFKIYKFNFLTAVHIGKRKLTDAENCISADTVFSALCHEALAIGGEELLENFVKTAKAGELRISDALPYRTRGARDDYYIPRPMMRIGESDGDGGNCEGAGGDSVDRKLLKKLKLVRTEILDDFLRGSADLQKEAELLKNIGESEIRTMAAVDAISDALPFSVGAYRFAENAGLYIITGYNDKAAADLLEKLLISLSFSGIGGKRSAGLGQFELEYGKLPEIFKKRLCCESGTGESGSSFLLLSSAMAADDELAEVLEEANYTLERRGGFIASHAYSESGENFKKRDFYSFKAGSVFKSTFEGIVADVSAGGTHKVYRYAKPIFLEVR